MSSTKREIDLFGKACDAYEAYCKRQGFELDMPSQKLSKVGWKYVHLNNVNGKIVKYIIRTRKIAEV